MSVRRFLEEKLGPVARLSEELLSLRRSLVSTLVGRDVSELLSDEYLAEIVLGGLRAEDWRRPRYPPGSLAGFYHDVLGIGVDNLKLLLARLSDGLPLRIATRGIRVVAENTEPLQLIHEINSLSKAMLEKLGKKTVVTPANREPGEQHTALEVLEELLRAITETLPPYSREAQILFSTGNGSLPRKLYEQLGNEEQKELQELGLGEEKRLPGCPDDPARCLLGAREGSIISLYYCYAMAAMRLTQDKSVKSYYNVQDALQDLLGTIDEQALTDPLLQELAQYSRKTPCLPKRECKTPPPCMPTGYVLAEISLPISDVIVQLPAGRETTIGEILEKIYPQLCKGLARITIDEQNHIQLQFTVKTSLPTSFLQETH